MYPNLIAELLSRGWTKEEIQKVANKNLLRVFKKVEEVAMGNKNMPDNSLIPEDQLYPNNTCRTAGK